MRMRKAYVTITGEDSAVGFAIELVHRDIPFGFQAERKASNGDRLFRFEVESRFSAVFPTPLDGAVQIDDSAPTEEELAALRDKANEQYCYRSDNDIEVDNEPRFSRGKGGTWVSGWLWIADEDEDAEDDEDEDEESVCSVCGEPLTTDHWHRHENDEGAFCVVALCHQPPQEGSALCVAHTGVYCEHGNRLEGDECDECAQEEEDQRVAALKLVRQVAGMTAYYPEIEQGAAETMNSLIARAKEVIA